MNTPSPADRVESALTPPWGPRLDHFLAARDEMKRPAPAHRSEDQGKRHERTDPHHVDHVEGGALPEADLALQYAFRRPGYAHGP